MMALQKWMSRRKYVAAFNFTTVTTTINTFQNLRFPGSARFLLGWTVWDDSLDIRNIFTINLNEENIVTDASWAEYCKVRFSGVGGAAANVLGTSFNGEYYPFPRALNGNDAVKISYTANTAGHIAFTFYFVNNLDVANQS